MAGSRIVAVDVFRGATIALMILVNNPGSWSHVYWPLRHAEWHGCTPTDLVFPFFLFIVGVSIVLALGGRVEAGSPRRPIVRKIVRRSVLLFAIGVALSAFPFVKDFLSWEWKDPGTLRIPGVLQRIAVCYLVVALLFLRCRARTLHVVTAVLLLGYHAIMTLVPVPGQTGSLDDKSGNLAAYVDRLVFGDHVWAAAKTWDPEGLLSTLGALATTLLGVSAGRILRSSDAPAGKALTLLVAGVSLALLGLCWSAWLHFPINKSLWTSSYVLFTGGLAMAVLGACVWLVDVRGQRRLAHPFTVYGVNALTVFVMSGVVGRLLSAIRWHEGAEQVVTLKQAIYRACYTSWIADPYVASLAFALTWVACWYAVLAAMHRRGIVIKL